MAADSPNDVLWQAPTRDYQLEMFRESMRRNVICVMDTGTGKTRIALLRMREELERQTGRKRVWFLCPTVALTEQQCRVVKQALPAFTTRMLCGLEGVDAWTNQQIWDQALEGIDIVVATHAVLRDAVVHGFVRFDSICLLVFDEAHHVSNNHPAKQIMERYRSQHNLHRPGILGLTASPVVRKRAGEQSLLELEHQLTASIVTPKLHRAQLMEYANRAHLSAILYDAGYVEEPKVYAMLKGVVNRMDVQDDPYLQMLKRDDRTGYVKTLEKGKTYCSTTMKKLLNTSKTILSELGPSLCVRYIRLCLVQIDNRRLTARADPLSDVYGLELDYLLRLLEPLRLQTVVPEVTGRALGHTSKVQSLIDLLQSNIVDDSRCIIFVKTRAAVALLHDLLSTDPKPCNRIRSATFVGASEYASRSNILELNDQRLQREALADLASGKTNVLICTSVAEEGIDVPACNVVVCFEPPSNLKSFVQRRGRARMKMSKFVLFLPGSAVSALNEWRDLEERMVEAYVDDMRELDEVKQAEMEAEEDDAFQLRIQATGAHLTLNDAVAHLYHFCAKLPGSAHVGPTFSFSVEKGGVLCAVTLPPSIDTSLQKSFHTTRTWRGQQSAKREACFQALLSLHRAGLINNHFLPSPPVDPDIEVLYEEIEKRPNLTLVDTQLSPWPLLAAAWTSAKNFRISVFTLTREANEPLRFNLILPRDLATPQPFCLCFDHPSNVRVELAEHYNSSMNGEILPPARQATDRLMSAVFQGRLQQARVDYLFLFAPTDVEDLHFWLEATAGTLAATALKSTADAGLVRDWGKGGKRYILAHTVGRANSTGFMLECQPMGKFSDLLRLSSVHQTAKSATYHLLDPQTCSVDKLPVGYAIMAGITPIVIHMLKVHYIVDQLCDTILAPVAFSDRSSVLQAVTTPRAREPLGADYQRLELLGDMVLKTLTSATLIAQRVYWHESYLSLWKDRIVSNGRLAIAAEKIGITRYILTEPFSGAKWKPPYTGDFLGQASFQAHGREFSTKTLADVCEALIGAAFAEGGFPKAMILLQLLVPEIDWQPIGTSTGILFDIAGQIKVSATQHTDNLGKVLDHHFIQPSLLFEMTTHASNISTIAIRSYDRLEFVGDALLDYVVCTRLYNSPKHLSVPRMHLLKTAAVNGNFLGYCALSTTIGVSLNDIDTIPVRDVASGKMTTETTFTPTTKQLSLPDFLRCTPDHNLAQSLRRTREHFAALEPLLDLALGGTSTRYPWTQLAAFAADKTFSDMVEAAIGAVWIDTRGDFAAVEALVRRFGILDWLDDAIERDVHVWHPKEEAGALVAKLPTFASGKLEYECSVVDDNYMPVWNEEMDDVVNARAAQDVWDESCICTGTGKGNLLCKLSLGGATFVEARGNSRMEAETRAAELAIAQIELDYPSLGPVEPRPIDANEVEDSNHPLVAPADEDQQDDEEHENLVNEAEANDDDPEYDSTNSDIAADYNAELYFEDTDDCGNDPEHDTAHALGRGLEGIAVAVREGNKAAGVKRRKIDHSG